MNSFHLDESSALDVTLCRPRTCAFIRKNTVGKTALTKVWSETRARVSLYVKSKNYGTEVFCGPSRNGFWLCWRRGEERKSVIRVLSFPAVRWIRRI